MSIRYSLALAWPVAWPIMLTFLTASIYAPRYKSTAHERNKGRGKIMPTTRRMRSVLTLVILILLAGLPAFAQMETATLSGVIQDPKGGVVPDVEVTATRIETGTAVTTKTNGAGIYFFTGLMPGHYHLNVRKPGFKEIAIKEFQLYVQDKLEQNFSLEIGSVSETVTVEAGGLNINTTDAAVSTVVDRQFAENLPMNGRSFQSLINLTPGVVTIPSNPFDAGQFTVNGQRGSSNYWMVDGVSANVGIGVAGGGTGTGNGLGGALGSFSALGGTNSLVSVDALQEFRIQTSTYAPEFGRTPGGQISIVTRSGANQFHGTVFDYFRNDVLDANNWFNTSVAPAIPKAKERQNDFGGTVSGPILKNKTFFFFSYEGFRLRLPQTALLGVPDLAARQSAVPAMQPFLNAFPLPNGTDNLATGVAQENASFSNPATLDAYSIRIDQHLGNRVSVFGRYNYSPSEIAQRGSSGDSLSTVTQTKITTQTGTVGATWTFSPSITSDLRFNYSKTEAHRFNRLDSFGGAAPLTSLPIPSSFDFQNSSFFMDIFSLPGGVLVDGEQGHNFQHQMNLVGSTSVQEKSHVIKIGIDFRRLSPQFRGQGQYQLVSDFLDVPSAKAASLAATIVGTSASPTFLLRNIGIYAQDTWRLIPRATLTYGLRWDLDLTPSSDPNMPAVVGFDLNNLSGLALAPAGVRAYGTTYGNVAPRLGVAYQLSEKRDWQTILRGGFGVFYDLSTAELGNQLGTGFYPFGGSKVIAGGTFPLSTAQLEPPSIAPPTKANGILFATDPNLKLPYTLEWNVAAEQGIGRQQTLSLSYVGAAGRHLLQQGVVSNPNGTLLRAVLLTNASTSDYDALQIQFQRRLSRGLQALVSYTWSHSIDTASAGSSFGSVNELLPSAISRDRGASDFDIRHTLSAALTYDIPALKDNPLTKALLGGWSTDNIISVRSAPPVGIFSGRFFALATQYSTLVRPDLVVGQPLYLFGPQFPGGKAINPAAFTDPPASGGVPLRQGDLPRNLVRGFGAAQWDFAVHRDFPIHESVHLQFRAEMFNVLNHPNFGPPRGFLGVGGFGLSTQMLSQSLSGSNVGGGGFSPLYQIGGPRSIQFALKLAF